MNDISALTQDHLTISNLGECKISSPLPLSTTLGDGTGNFILDTAKILHTIEIQEGVEPNRLAFEKAGARQKIYFKPADTRAAIVTCGGLCPGLNNIIRSLYYVLTNSYGVQSVLGIRYGYQGLNPELARRPITLTEDLVDEIHHQGGTILGTSRGPQDPKITVDYLVEAGINLLFCVGGDGTQRGAYAIGQEIERRGLKISVVGIPKTIDNDIVFCHRTFGFMSAVAEAELVLDRAHVEAKSVINGVGLVKVMGRDAGFIATGATIASGQVNFALIPEVPFTLSGPDSFLTKLERRLAAKEHALVIVAEGAGQELLEGLNACDASGNKKLSNIGRHLKEKITEHFKAIGKPISVKYVDPSYHIRSVPANAADSMLCEQFARLAVHAAMAGKTNMFVGLWHDNFIHVPYGVTSKFRRRVSAEGDWWVAVQAMTGQEDW